MLAVFPNRPSPFPEARSELLSPESSVLTRRLSTMNPLRFDHTRHGPIQHHFPHDHYNTAIEFGGWEGQHWRGDIRGLNNFHFQQEDGSQPHINHYIDFTG